MAGKIESPLDYHRRLKGKIRISLKERLTNRRQLALAYTPGVAEVSRAIAGGKDSREFTWKGNAVAIVTDGSRVLGLGNIGPQAALPVMEGKAQLFSRLAKIDAVPICLGTQDEHEIVSFVRALAPTFGAINLEDIETPKCYRIERALADIGIPVMHDDQHGTAIVILAGLINAARVVNKPFSGLTIVVSGAGAAGSAIAKLLVCAEQDSNICQSAAEVLVCDRQGILVTGRAGMDEEKTQLAKITNPNKRSGTLVDALKDADAVVGVSGPGILNVEMIKSMAKKPIVFALANPVPEIDPDLARIAGAAVIATGRSDYPNQVNNALAFPGLFRGLLDAKAAQVTNPMKLAAAFALARTIQKPSAQKILPSVFDPAVVKSISTAVKTLAGKK